MQLYYLEQSRHKYDAWVTQITKKQFFFFSFKTTSQWLIYQYLVIKPGFNLSSQKKNQFCQGTWTLIFSILHKSINCLTNNFKDYVLNKKYKTWVQFQYLSPKYQNLQNSSETLEIYIWNECKHV